MPEPVTLSQIEAARDRIAGQVVVTPCPSSLPLSELTGCDVSCKLEYLQRTGSFKERGACNALLALEEATRRRGVVAASAGNHALALAYHGGQLGVPVTVVMPTYAPLIKVATCRRLGAEVMVEGEDFAAARALADRVTQQRGLTYIHGYDDRSIIAGQGTLGLELVEQVPDLDAVIVPIGGAGLIAGVATAIKARRPGVRVIGVEPARMPGFTRSREAGRVVRVDSASTLADGLAVGRVGELAFASAQPHVDRVVRVDEGELALAILRLVELEKAVVEGAGAAPLAALMGGQLEELRGKRVVLPLCGGNIDPLVLGRVIEHGMVVDGRLCRLSVSISDRPGGLAKLTTLLAQEGASVKRIGHDRAFAGPDVSAVRVIVILETRDADHARQVCDRLDEAGFVHRLDRQHRH